MCLMPDDRDLFHLLEVVKLPAVDIIALREGYAKYRMLKIHGNCTEANGVLVDMLYLVLSGMV